MEQLTFSEETKSSEKLSSSDILIISNQASYDYFVVSDWSFYYRGNEEVAPSDQNSEPSRSRWRSKLAAENGGWATLYRFGTTFSRDLHKLFTLDGWRQTCPSYLCSDFVEIIGLTYKKDPVYARINCTRNVSLNNFFQTFYSAKVRAQHFSSNLSYLMSVFGLRVSTRKSGAISPRKCEVFWRTSDFLIARLSLFSSFSFKDSPAQILLKFVKLWNSYGRIIKIRLFQGCEPCLNFLEQRVFLSDSDVIVSHSCKHYIYLCQ